MRLRAGRAVAERSISRASPALRGKLVIHLARLRDGAARERVSNLRKPSCNGTSDGATERGEKEGRGEGGREGGRERWGEWE